MATAMIASGTRYVDMKPDMRRLLAPVAGRGHRAAPRPADGRSTTGLALRLYLAIISPQVSACVRWGMRAGCDRGGSRFEPRRWHCGGPAFAQPLFPEIDCMRSILPPGVIAAAEDRAVRTGFGADRALIGAGAVSDDDYLRVLGTATGVPFEPLNGVSRQQCPLSDERLIDAAAAGLLPLTDGDGLRLVVAPRGMAARRLLRLIDDDPAQAAPVLLHQCGAAQRFRAAPCSQAIVARAAERLAETWPMLSAAPSARRASRWPVAGLLLLVLVAASRHRPQRCWSAN